MAQHTMNIAAVPGAAGSTIPAAAAAAAATPAPVAANGASELIEVKEAMREAVAVFNRVKTEKMTSETPNAPAESHLLGVPKDIVDKAFKQKERERANRASAAASRNKVMRYQIELESRLNRVEAERNSLRATVAQLRAERSGAASAQHAVDLAVARAALTKVRHAQAAALAAVVPLPDVDAFLGGSSAPMARVMGIPCEPAVAAESAAAAAAAAAAKTHAAAAAAAAVATQTPAAATPAPAAQAGGVAAAAAIQAAQAGSAAQGQAPAQAAGAAAQTAATAAALPTTMAGVVTATEQSVLASAPVAQDAATAPVAVPVAGEVPAAKKSRRA